MPLYGPFPGTVKLPEGSLPGLGGWAGLAPAAGARASWAPLHACKREMGNILPHHKTLH